VKAGPAAARSIAGRVAIVIAAMVAAGWPLAALAHEGGHGGGGFAAGFLHPIAGPDHVIAMVAVGLWGAFLGAPALWLLPVVFPLVMVAGGVLGLAGVPLPAVEVGIALSAVAIGGAVAAAWRAPVAVAAVLVAAFAVFHGHAHGTELPEATNPVAYSLGFVTATGLLHAAGIGLGALTRAPAGARLVRGLGGLIALGGAVFLARAL
jgi:urease accessory protein